MTPSSATRTPVLRPPRGDKAKKDPRSSVAIRCANPARDFSRASGSLDKRGKFFQALAGGLSSHSQWFSGSGDVFCSDSNGAKYPIKVS